MGWWLDTGSHSSVGGGIDHWGGNPWEKAGGRQSDELMSGCGATQGTGEKSVSKQPCSPVRGSMSRLPTTGHTNGFLTQKLHWMCWSCWFFSLSCIYYWRLEKLEGVSFFCSNRQMLKSCQLKKNFEKKKTRTDNDPASLCTPRQVKLQGLTQKQRTIFNQPWCLGPHWKCMGRWNATGADWTKL